MAASPSLSHSSQDKAEEQGWIRINQVVSDECGSGVVRVVQEAQSIPGVCSLCAEADAGILELVRERSAISKQGEPLGCHANGCRVWLSW